MMAELRRRIANWWTPTRKVQAILDNDGAQARESRVMEATRDAYRAQRLALEIETEIRLRARGPVCCADNS